MKIIINIALRISSKKTFVRNYNLGRFLLIIFAYK